MKEAEVGSTFFCDAVPHHLAILFETFAQELVSLRMDLHVYKLKIITKTDAVIVYN
jgi:hypothetical protein